MPEGFWVGPFWVFGFFVGYVTARRRIVLMLHDRGWRPTRNDGDDAQIGDEILRRVANHPYEQSMDGCMKCGLTKERHP